jgi:hypothetical protein
MGRLAVLPEQLTSFELVAQESWCAMTSRIIGSRLGILSAAGAIFVCGCDNPEGAGTVSMTAVKSAAAQRGIPESKNPGAPKTKESSGQKKTPPFTPVPRGAR